MQWWFHVLYAIFNIKYYVNKCIYNKRICDHMVTEEHNDQKYQIKQDILMFEAK